MNGDIGEAWVVGGIMSRNRGCELRASKEAQEDHKKHGFQRGVNEGGDVSEEFGCIVSEGQ